MPETPPVAQPFYGSGAGNGFPFCLRKIDVTDRGDGQPYDYWTTLSGVNKDSPATSDALIAESLVLASRLYWFGYSIGFNGSATSGGNSESLSSANLSAHPNAEPKKRVCPVDNIQGDYAENAGNGVRVTARFSMLQPTMLYNGATTDEANFVGYASYVANPDTRTGFNLYATYMGWAEAYMGSFCTAQLHSAIGKKTLPSDVTFPATIDYAYVELEGMHFVCRADAALSGTHTVDASTLSSSVITEFGSESVELTSLGFYT